MKIVEIRLYQTRIPFTFSINHHLKNRNCSESLIVVIKSDNGKIGFGEGAPRPYVTQENLVQCFEQAELGSQDMLGQELLEVVDINNILIELKNKNISPAVCCAFELALLDLLGKEKLRSLSQLLGYEKVELHPYSGILPFLPLDRFSRLLEFIKTLELTQVKIKVGAKDDQKRLQKTRIILGPEVDIRLDANRAWTYAQAVEQVKSFEDFNISGIEEPLCHDEVPRLIDLNHEINTPLILDESVCTLAQAKYYAGHIPPEKLLFNIKISKTGGIQAAASIYQFAQQKGIPCQLGCNVGESAILTAAGRLFAQAHQLRFLEGSYATFFMEDDILDHPISFVKGGIASTLDQPGLGIDINLTKIEKYSQQIKVSIDQSLKLSS